MTNVNITHLSELYTKHGYLRAVAHLEGGMEINFEVGLSEAVSSLEGQKTVTVDQLVEAFKQQLIGAVQEWVDYEPEDG